MELRHLINQLKYEDETKQLVLELITKTGRSIIIKDLCILIDYSGCICITNSEEYDEEEEEEVVLKEYYVYELLDMLKRNPNIDVYLDILRVSRKGPNHSQLYCNMDYFDIIKKDNRIHLIHNRNHQFTCN